MRKHLRDLMRVFAGPEEGFSIHAILGDRGEPGFKEELAELARNRENFQFTFVPELHRPIHLMHDLRAYSVIKERLRALNPDIVHTHSSKAGILGRYAAHYLGIKKIIHTPHVFSFQWEQGLKRRLYLALERQAARHCQALVCVGESQRADALSRGLTESEKLLVIPNGMSVAAPVPAAQRAMLRASLGLTDTSLAVGMVARLAPQKGVGSFVAAAAKVLEKRPEAIFFLVGGGPLEAEVRSRMAELKLSAQNFRLLGHREDAPLLYPAFDVVVLSSLYEGLPYVLLEAMAWGVPVVATDVLGSRDVVADGETGFLARVNDPGHIAERTLLLLDDEPLRRRFSQAARKRVAECFSFEAFVEGHRRLYRN